MSGGFERLSPALQFQIVNGLCWEQLRPVQEAAIGPILDGDNCLVLAPTAGGKTEAAMLPLISAMDREDWRPVSVIYVAPLRSLLNDLEPRLQELAGLVGRRAFKWHGDVSAGDRRRFCSEPSDVLATTPESLEAMLVSTSVPVKRVLGNVRSVVVDEAHSFAAGDRGGHLTSVLERVRRIARTDLQRIALSATVGNPEEILGYFSGSSERRRVVVAAGVAVRDARISIDHVESLANASLLVERLHAGRKRLVFADSRRKVEELGHLLRQRGVNCFVSHSSLAAGERELAERAFRESKDCVIVATSAMELGIDVGDLDHVLQIDAPGSVASFLQRMGRTGRRPGAKPNCTFLTIDDDGLLRALALVRLHRRGYVEPVLPGRRAAHVLAHQLMALCLQHHGVPTTDWWAWVAGASAFSELDDHDRSELVKHMVHEGIVAESDGRLVLGPRGSKLYGGKNFMELYAVFSTPPVFVVMAGPTEVGTIDAFFVERRTQDELAFVLGGRSWRVTGIDWGRGKCYVEPATDAGYPRWGGEPVLLGREVCREICAVLRDGAVDASWSRRTREAVELQREKFAFLAHDAPWVRAAAGRVEWWTFAGGRANNVLRTLLEKRLGDKVTADNFFVAVLGEAGRSEQAVRGAIHDLARELTETELLGALDETDASQRVSKFQPCLSPRLVKRLIADRLNDAPGAVEVLRGH